jgi:hypothetical protein
MILSGKGKGKERRDQRGAISQGRWRKQLVVRLTQGDLMMTVDWTFVDWVFEQCERGSEFNLLPFRHMYKVRTAHSLFGWLGGLVTPSVTHRIAVDYHKSRV